MEKLKLEFNKPKDAALKFAKGKRGESRIPGKGDWFMYTLLSGEVLFIDSDDCQDPDEMFAAANIGARDPFRICLRKSKQGARYLEVHALSDAAESPEPHSYQIAEPPLDPHRYPDEAGSFEPPTKLASQLSASIDRVKAQRAGPSKIQPAAPISQAPSTHATATRQEYRTPTGPIALMTASLMAAVDCCIAAQNHAHAQGFEMEFSAECIEKIGVSLYIDARKDPLFQVPEANGGAQPWRQ